MGEGRAYGDGTKVTERAQNADFCRTAKFKHLEGTGFSQKTTDFRRKPKIFVGASQGICGRMGGTNYLLSLVKILVTKEAIAGLCYQE